MSPAKIIETIFSESLHPESKKILEENHMEPISSIEIGVVVRSRSHCPAGNHILMILMLIKAPKLGITPLTYVGWKISIHS
jgi:hypothetical protein